MTDKFTQHIIVQKKDNEKLQKYLFSEGYSWYKDAEFYYLNIDVIIISLQESKRITFLPYSDIGLSIINPEKVITYEEKMRKHKFKRIINESK